MKPYFFIFIGSLVLVFFGLIPNTFGQDISFSPTRIFFHGNPGETVSEQITVNNSGKIPYEFIVQLKDWNRDSTGNKLYFPMGTLKYSNAKEIQLQGTSLSVSPGESKTFTISITIPKEGIERSTNSMVFFTQTNAREAESKNEAGIGIKMSLELGIQLFYDAYGLKKGELKFLGFEERNMKNNEKIVRYLAVKFENSGDMNRDGVIRFELTHKQSGSEIKAVPIPLAIMPKDSQWVYYTLPDNLEPGTYLAVAILESGDHNTLKVAEKDIYVKK